MNWKHVEAVMKGAGRFHRATFGDRVLITNEHMALFYPDGEFDIPDGQHFAPLVKTWSTYAVKLGEPVTPTGLYRNGFNYARRLGDLREFIDEAYYRCFDSAVTWHLGPAPPHSDGYHCVVVCIGDVPIAIVMPTRASVSAATEWQRVSDSDVFEPFCLKENDYYLITRQKLKDRIEDALELISNARKKIDELESEIGEYEVDISGLERKMNALTVERTTAESKTDAG